MISERSVLVVEDDMALCEAVVDTLETAGFDVRSAHSMEDAAVLLRQQKPKLVLSDWHLQGERTGHDLLHFVRRELGDLPVVLMTAFGNVGNAVKAMQDGATDYLQKPFDPDNLVELLNLYVNDTQAGNKPVAADPRSKEVLQLAERVAGSDATVMLTGPSGVGKEVLARFIHQQSARANQAFVAINCAAIPENMLEATLFGYEKGAFTGAHQACPGKFEQAQGGTLLLDEISEMDLGLQAKLLRVLQEREVERLGGRKAIPLDVRVIATSNRNMREEVRANRFREDLYFRLNVFPIKCLSLAERPGDIVPLTEHLLNRHAQRASRPVPTLSESAKQALTGYNWPGNVRELDNAVQRALILQTGRELSAEDFQLSFHQEDQDKSSQTGVNDSTLGDAVRRIEYERILMALKDSEQTREGLARQLGMSPRTLRYKIARMRDLGYEVPDA